VAAIGTLLMIVPDVQALECYYYTNATSAMGGRAAWELNKMFRIENGQEENPLTLSIGDGHPTRQCSAGFNFCATLRCAKLYGTVCLDFKK
jgi:hypothetical protein